MVCLIFDSKVMRAELSTGSSASSHGVPVLLVKRKDTGDQEAYGPADRLPSGISITAEQLVKSFVNQAGSEPCFEPRTDDSLHLANRFLSQLPDEATPEVDITIENHGTVFLACPKTEKAKAWLKEHVASDSQWFSDALAVRPRCITNLVDGMQDDGLVVK